MRVKKKVEGIKKGTSSTNPDRLKTKGSDRTRATINRLNMMKHGGKKIRGEIENNNFDFDISIIMPW